MHVSLAILLLTAALQPSPHLEARTYNSTVFGGSRRVQVYMPPAGARPIAGLLVCLWGQDYVGEIKAPETLDALIRAGRVPPVAAIFLEGADDRFQDIGTTRRMADSIAGEVIPWAKSALGLAFDARHTIVCGYSAAGLGATYAAYAHPDVIGNVLSQSGAFWRGFDGDGASETEWVTKHYRDVPKRETRFSLEVGGAETRPAGGTAISIKVANEHLRDVLNQKGYDLTYVEVPGAQHEYGHWKAAFGPALAALTKDWK
jgi:enterochelin esterase-like enzyme